MKRLMNLKFIIGEAGTAKTTTLKTIQDNFKKSFVCLAFTHSAANNMIEKGLTNVKTLHSFFRIMPNTTFINLPNELPKLIIIDEFSLIPVDLLESIFKNIEKTGQSTTVVCAGDLLQLPPISESSEVDLSKLDCSRVKLKGCCSLEDARKIFYDLGRTLFVSDYYINNKKLVLTKNFRCGTDVMDVLTKVLSTGICEISPLPNDESYVFIASTYENLKKMYQKKKTTIKTRMGFVEYNSDKEYVLTENINEDFYNGDYVKIASLNVNEGITITKSNCSCLIQVNKKYGCYPLLPSNYLSIHYAQGRGFNNVCLCVDDLFEIGMLYTAITRAKNKICFCSFKEQTKVDVSDITRPFNLMKENIY